jgi:leucyl aminopeptidase
MTLAKYELVGEKLGSTGYDTLIVFAYVRGERTIIDDKINEFFKGLPSKVIRAEGFKAEAGSTITIYLEEGEFKRLVITGVGDCTLEDFRVGVASAVAALSKTRAEKILFSLEGLPLDGDEAAENIVIASELTLYDPGYTYKSREKPERRIKSIGIHDPRGKVNRSVIDLASKVADSVNYARMIGDAPSSEMNPEKIEEEARKLAEKYGLTMKVLHAEDLAKEGLNGILAVGKGGSVSPRLIILGYKGRSGEDWDVAVVGKTVTFDAGGLNIKPTGYIEEMKFDKCGGAAALGIIRAAASLKIPVNLLAVLPVVENMPGGNSYRPKDVLRMYNGLTVEVNNTDAEGRLILADALSYVEKNYSPSEIFDLATLTGAVVIALGNYAAGLFTENDEKARKLYELGLKTGEKVWRLPLWKEYYAQLKSDVADVSNIGGRPAGSITAAAFLSKFVEHKDRWVHLDIAGTTWVQKGHPKKPYYKNAATGFGVRLLTYYLIEKYGLGE